LEHEVSTIRVSGWVRDSTSVARFSGSESFRRPDPRATLAALAHPGLNSVAAPRLVDANKPI